MPESYMRAPKDAERLMARPSLRRRRIGAATRVVAMTGLLCAACGGGQRVPGALSCNGSAALCSRPPNEVIFPGTHNSFAASDRPGWYFASQTYPIDRQLQDGI